MEQKNANEQETPRQAGCFVGATAMLERLWSQSARDHFRNSRIEFLKGIRTLIDDRISHLSSHESKGRHVPVE